MKKQETKLVPPVLERRMCKVSEVSNVLGCSDQTTRKLVLKGELERVLVGRVWRITLDSVERFIVRQISVKATA